MRRRKGAQFDGLRVEDGYVSIGDLVAEIKRGLASGGLGIPDRQGQYLRLLRLRLKLEVATVSVEGGGVELRVPVLGAMVEAKSEHASHSAQTVEITLRPPEVDTTVAADVAGAITESIQTIKRVLVEAQDQDQLWIMEDAVITIDFGVDERGSIRLGVTAAGEQRFRNLLTLQFDRISTTT